MIVWPWQPRSPVRETNEWLTDVIRSKGREQRWSMRLVPRQNFEFRHTFTEEQYNGARSIIRQQDTILMPDWTMARRVGLVEPDSSPHVTYDMDYQFSIGDRVLIWESEDKYDACVVLDTDSSNTISLDSVDNNYEDALVMPLRTAQIPDGLAAQATANKYIECSIEFECTDSIDLGLSEYPSYQGDDAINECPIIAGQSFSEPINYPFERVDGSINYPTLLSKRNLYDANYMMRWHVFNDDDLMTLRRFIHSRRGKWKSFWMSSYRRDFELAATLGSSSTTVQVHAPGGVLDLGVDSFDIDINGYRRRVNSYLATTLNGEDVLELTIDSSTGVSITTDKRVSYLRHVRFDADRIEFNHQAGAGVTCQVPCIEVNQ